ncbi:hypothetical protein LSTR_LSTR016358 [Laodelphax striatellus]|uniref:Uncharacterized protein n=1 Tax=Laodelphax striatellus TaxID=195883 RepID=A0A482XIN9_LAOST|nr:hypothetical protein LSTR_LSTR002977 [Laodelphax striatellus]RZF45151.1 hypothetical protein LSTR_LSTR016358 [Laodelphax striatellus]
MSACHVLPSQRNVSARLPPNWPNQIPRRTHSSHPTVIIIGIRFVAALDKHNYAEKGSALSTWERGEGDAALNLSPTNK